MTTFVPGQQVVPADPQGLFGAPALATVGDLTEAERTAVAAATAVAFDGPTYNGAGELTSYVRYGILHTVSYPDASTVVIENTTGARVALSRASGRLLSARWGSGVILPPAPPAPAPPSPSPPAPTPPAPPATPLGVTTVRVDGIWTWFTRPEVLQVGDMLYVGWVDSAGTCGATQYNLVTRVGRHFNLSQVGLEVDDHNNTSFVVLENGRIGAFYGSHNDSEFKYRVYDPDFPFDSPAAWTAEQARGVGGGAYSYPNPFRLSQDSPRVWLFKRRWLDGTGTTRALAYRTAANLTGPTPHAWSPVVDVYAVSGRIPYWRIATDGARRFHFAITDGHPVQGQISLFHFYGQLDGSNTMRWYRTDGTEITAPLPLGPANLTPIYDGSAVRCWVSDCTIDSDGHPRILWMRYPNNNGTQIEYWHSRWTGLAWVSHKIMDDGPGLTPLEQFYHGGLAFDRQDANRIYPSAPIAGIRQVQDLRTTDNGATWTLNRVLTNVSAAGDPLCGRPIGIQGGDGRVRVAWWEAPDYAEYTDFGIATIKVSG